MAPSEAGNQEENISVSDTIPVSRNQENWKDFFIELIENRNREDLVRYLGKLYPADLAGLLTQVGLEKGFFLYEILDQEIRGEVLHELDEDVRKEYLEVITVDEIADIVRIQESDEAVHLLQDLDSETRGKVLENIPNDERLNIAELLSYRENTAGSIMSKEFIYVLDTDTVKKAIQSIRKYARDVEDFYTVYVLDSDGVYKGHISLKTLFLSNPRGRVKKLMENELLPIQHHLDQEEVAKFFTRYDFITAPVVDERGIMIGRITADDVMEVMEEEASEDILRLGGVISGDETMSTPLVSSSLKRMLWLGMNLITAFIAAGVVSYFESTISHALILAALMPIVAGIGGNAAGQSVAVIVRNIALGEVSISNARRAITREFLLGLLNGLFIGILTGLAVYLVSWNIHGLSKATALAGIIFFAMFINMIIAALAGAGIPLIMKKLGADPAVASGIFVTACTDILGFFVFLGLATLAIIFKFI